MLGLGMGIGVGVAFWTIIPQSGENTGGTLLLAESGDDIQLEESTDRLLQEVT